MEKVYNPDIQTYNETPSAEAVKAASMISKYAYWMANERSEDKFINAFGPVMGKHFWHKLTSIAAKCESAAEADIRLWYEMSNTYRPVLMHYILRTGYKG